MKPNTIHSLVLAGTLLLSPLAQAGSTDYTDVWWNPQQSGWGLNLAEQGDRIYATLHAYDTNGAPLWYVTYLDEQDDGSFTGNVHTFTSTPTSAPLSPGQTGATVRGTLKFVPLSASEGRIYYNINGQQGEQPVKRFSLFSQSAFLTSNPMTGSNEWDYAIFSIKSNCTSYFYVSPSNWPSSAPTTVKTIISEDRAAPFIRIDFKAGARTYNPITRDTIATQEYSCTITGQLKSDGRVSKIDDAKYSCQKEENQQPVWTQLPVKVTNIRLSASQLDGYWDGEIPNLDLATNTQSGTCNQKGHFIFSMTP